MEMKPLLLLCIMLSGTLCMGIQSEETGDASLPELVQNRRSIRRYTNEKIDREILENIVKIGMFAPSSYGQNPVEFVVVEDKEKLTAIANAKKIGAPSVRAASAAIVVIVDTSKGELWIEDSSAAASYILLAAEHYGIGTCWNQIRDREGQNFSAGREIREILGIPSRYAVLCVIAMGHKAEQKAPHTEKDLNMQRMHFDKF
ncbi:MAG: nitroreductase family protein [Akkermansia sp.]|nr:nitroreductase family protein [Akkermansia sp.]MCD8071372.1 nitroreductase family protein [Akkermansiaceae bacterium]